jgi:hypothetical protein
MMTTPKITPDTYVIPQMMASVRLAWRESDGGIHGSSRIR